MFLLTSAALAVLTLTLLTSLRYFRHKPNHQLPDGKQIQINVQAHKYFQFH